MRNKWIDRVLVMGIVIGAFVAGFSGRSGDPGLYLGEPVRLLGGLIIAVGCAFAVVERVVTVERQCAASASQRAQLTKIILTLAADGANVNVDEVLDLTDSEHEHADAGIG